MPALGAALSRSLVQLLRVSSKADRAALCAYSWSLSGLDSSRRCTPVNVLAGVLGHSGPP
eukprot:SM000195S05263  [mRNA]  locus=s195:60547:60731:- [translate_table: standard]